MYQIDPGPVQYFEVCINLRHILTNNWKSKTSWASIKSMSWKRRLFRCLPLSIREVVFRRALEEPDREFLSRDIEIKVAETSQEVLEAYHLIYETYYDSGFCDIEQEGIRLTKHALLPTTSLIIVKYRGEVIATLSHIMDNPLGLPMEKLWPLDFLRDTGRKIAEISTLAIKKGHRRQRGKILLPLMIFLYKYSIEHLGTDYFVISTHPDALPFYTGLFAFQPIDNKVKSYGSVKGALATGQFAHLTSKEFHEFINNCHIGKRDKKFSVSSLFNLDELGCFTYPERRYYRAYDPCFKVDLLKQVFNKKLNSLKTLGIWEREILSNQFSYDEYKNVFEITSDDQNPSKPQNVRSSPRHWVNCPGTLIDYKNAKLRQIRIYNVSQQGLLFHINDDALDGDINVDFTGTIHCKVSEDKEVKLDIRVVRTKHHQYGAKILAASPYDTWIDFMDYLEEILVSNKQKRDDFEQLLKKLKAA